MATWPIIVFMELCHNVPENRNNLPLKVVFRADELPGFQQGSENQ